MGASPTGVPKKEEAVEEKPVAADAAVAAEEVTPDNAGLRPDGWEGVVWDCERAFGCPDHVKTPDDSNIPNLIAELKLAKKNMAVDMINLAKGHL